MTLARLFVVSSLTAVVALSAPACGGAGQSTTVQRNVPDHCRKLDIVSEAAQTLSTTLDIIEANNPDATQAAAEIRMYAEQRIEVTKCIRILMPAINARLESDRELLKEYARKVGPTQERATKIRKAMPKMFEDAGVRAAIKTTQ